MLLHLSFEISLAPFSPIGTKTLEPWSASERDLLQYFRCLFSMANAARQESEEKADPNAITDGKHHPLLSMSCLRDLAATLFGGEVADGTVLTAFARDAFYTLVQWEKIYRVRLDAPLKVSPS